MMVCLWIKSNNFSIRLDTKEILIMYEIFDFIVCNKNSYFTFRFLLLQKKKKIEVLS